MAHTSCSDCKDEGAGHALECKDHSVCQDCLKKRAQDDVSKMFNCSLCQESQLKVVAEANPTEPGIWIYVDDSNLWIEAKKLQGKLKGFKTCEDHRVRIDTGRLTDVLAGGRPVEKGILYGSIPPAIDKVWEKIRSKGWKVKTSKKSRITGKEKKVDTKLVADVTERVCITVPKKRTTIVLVTGDADMLPAIEKVVEHGWKAEIYMWEQALSADLKIYAKENSDSCEVTFLDNFITRVTFTNRKFNIKNEKLKKQLNAYGVVFSMRPDMFENHNHIPTEQWCNLLESISQWPLEHYWFVCDDMPTDDLVVVFREDSRGRHRFNVDQFLKVVKTEIEESELEGEEVKYALPGVVAIQTFRQYITKKFDQIDEHGMPMRVHIALDQPGDFSTDDICEGSENKEAFEQRSSEAQCPYKFNCSLGISCDHNHTDAEEAFFRKNGGRGNRFRKVKPCRFLPNCKKPKDQCLGAHGEEDAWCLWCLNCRCTGHFTDNCPLKRASQSP